MKILDQSFYNRSPLLVAPEILGKILVRHLEGRLISGRIVEVEAYLGLTDKASHSFRGITKRNASLFKDAGHAYVHSIHTQNCLDIVTQDSNIPSSILIRALEPIEGIDLMKKFRNKENLKDLTSGPGKLTQALKITKGFDGLNITGVESNLYVIDDDSFHHRIILRQRIGISKDKDNDFRFYIENNQFVSKK